MTDVKQVEITDAQESFDALMDHVASGGIVVLARGGGPVAKILPYAEAQSKKTPRFGFLDGAFQIPDDFDTMGQSEVEEMFYGPKRRS